jgi:hypothetical protein
MEREMAGRAIAGTARVIGQGVTITREIVEHHYSRTHTSATPEFSELKGLKFIEAWPGALSGVKIVFEREC